MDYKSRHHDPLIWTHDIFDSAQFPEPYGGFGDGHLFEIIAPDTSTIFLMMHGYIEPSESVAVTYAIEAPRSCPTRIAFERGQISWLEFWESRGWLLRFRIRFGCRPVEAEFIDPTKLDLRTIHNLTKLGNRGPFEIRLHELKRQWELAENFECDPIKAEHEYRNFLMLYAEKCA